MPDAGRIAMIAAVAENGVIGRDGDMPWHVSSDLKRFKALTDGHALVIGRKTHQSIGRPLPGRRTIVVTRGTFEAVECVASLEEALTLAGRPVFLAGGAGIYAEGMAHADTLHITRVHAAPEGDAWFPPIDDAFVLAAREPQPRGPRDDHAITYETYVRQMPSR